LPCTQVDRLVCMIFPSTHGPESFLQNPILQFPIRERPSGNPVQKAPSAFRRLAFVGRGRYQSTPKAKSRCRRAAMTDRNIRYLRVDRFRHKQGHYPDDHRRSITFKILFTPKDRYTGQGDRRAGAADLPRLGITLSWGLRFIGCEIGC